MESGIWNWGALRANAAKSQNVTDDNTIETKKRKANEVRCSARRRYRSCGAPAPKKGELILIAEISFKSYFHQDWCKWPIHRYAPVFVRCASDENFALLRKPIENIMCSDSYTRGIPEQRARKVKPKPTALHENGRDEIRAEIVSTCVCCNRKILLVPKIALRGIRFPACRGNFARNWIDKSEMYVIPRRRNCRRPKNQN